MRRQRDNSSNLSGVISCVLFDFGGVVIESPFAAFAKYEEKNGLPRGFLRSVNASDPDDNAWARLERNEVSIERFDELFAVESAALGHRVSGVDVLELLHGDLRPRMLWALDELKLLGYRIACLTNNVRRIRNVGPDIADAMAVFEKVYESSQMGVRKPDPAFYRWVLEDLGIEGREAAFLDDLGVNLKPARALGMHTIKVIDEDQALGDLADLLGRPSLRAPVRPRRAD